MKVLFDEGHGQVNWAQTGYPAKRLSTTFAGVGDRLGMSRNPLKESDDPRSYNCYAAFSSVSSSES